MLAAELMVVVIVSFPLRKRIGGKNWRRLHWATYAIFVLSTAHGLAAGTDSGQVWAMDMYLGAVGAVAFATVYRVLPGAQPRTQANHNPKETPMYKIEIDRSLCSGFGTCAEMAPEIFELDDSGTATVRRGESDDPNVLEAAAGCPMAAIMVTEAEAA